MGLYEILKASKLGAGAAPDMYTALFAQKINKGGGEAELSGVPPLTFLSNGTPLLDYLISGNMSQAGTPTPDNPIQPQECGERTAQLFDKSVAVNGKWLNVNTGLEENTTNLYWLSEYIPVKSGTTYSFSNPKSSRRWHYDGS